MTKRRSTPLHNPDIEGHHCTVEVRLEKLGMTPFLAKLSTQDLRNINKQFSATHFSEGDTIYDQDEHATLLRVVVHGKVKLIRHTLEGKDVLLDMLKPGEFFGSLSVLGDNVYTETARAQTDACILSIDLQKFQSVLKEYPQVAVSALDIMAERLQSSQDKVRQLATISVKQRIANVLVTLCDKFGENSRHGKLLQLPLSRKDLADMTGTSTETASRIMSQLQEEGIITSGRQWVAINDPDRLKEIAEE